MLHIPTHPDALTATWLTAALRQWGGAGGVTVAALTVTPLVEGEGFFGQLARVRLEYADEEYANAAPGAPHTLVAKFSASTPAMRARSIDSYAREVRFYQQLAPTTPLTTPTCYYADIDRVSGWHILLLQDLAPMHCGSRVAGCTIEQARSAVETITRLHLRWWGQTAHASFDWVAGGGTLGDPVEARQQYDAWWTAFYAQAQALLPDALVEPSARLGQHSATLRQHVFGGAPCTLIHRDFQLGNLFFAAAPDQIAGKRAGSDNPAFAVVDWQFVSRGLGVWDVAYFLSESLLPDNRRHVEMTLLREYHRALVQHGISDYPFAQCYDDYRLALLQRHTALVSTIAAMPFSTEQRHIHLDILLPRNLAALQDHDAFASLSKWDAHSGEN